MDNNMQESLENLLICSSLNRSDRDCVEIALDDGYDNLDDVSKSRIRRLLNQRAANLNGTSPLARYRMRRAATALATAKASPAALIN